MLIIYFVWSKSENVAYIIYSDLEYNIYVIP
jgi:hypothetical protein